MVNHQASINTHFPLAQPWFLVAFVPNTIVPICFSISLRVYWCFLLLDLQVFSFANHSSNHFKCVSLTATFTYPHLYLLKPSLPLSKFVLLWCMLVNLSKQQDILILRRTIFINPKCKCLILFSIISKHNKHYCNSIPIFTTLYNFEAKIL